MLCYACFTKLRKRCSGSGLGYRHFETSIGVWVSHMHFNLGAHKQQRDGEQRRCISGIYWILAVQDSNADFLVWHACLLYLVLFYLYFFLVSLLFSTRSYSYVLGDTTREVYSAGERTELLDGYIAGICFVLRYALHISDAV